MIDAVWECSLIEKLTGSYNWFYFERIGKTIHTHVIKASTFIHRKVGCPHVNHIDGNKKNNDLLNLEWVSPTQNLIHAFVMGLRTDNKPVTVLDKETGKFEEFFSLNEASLRLGVNPEKLHRYLKSLRNALFQKRYVVLWGYENIVDISKRISREHLNGAPRNVKVLDEKENRITIYGSLGSAARALSLTVGQIHYYLRFPDKSFGGLRFSYVVEDVVGPVIIDWVVPRPPKRKPLAIKVTNPEDNQTTTWNSIEEFAGSHGATKAAVQKAVYLKGSWHNYEIEYLR